MNLFYPSHDIALANGVRHFNPPAAALRLQEDLASLAEIWNHPFREGRTSCPLPWGWDWDTRRYIHDSHKIPYSDLPSDDDLQCIRQLSSRQTMISLLQNVERKLQQPFAHQQEYLTNMQDVLAYIQKQDERAQKFVFKTPWSSSGRGLTISHIRNKEGGYAPTPRTVIIRHAEATIKKMGGIMAEDWIENKLHDFALLFHASSKEVRFIGFSLFDNDETASGTTYRQGYLLSNEAIQLKLGIQKLIIDELIAACTTTLEELLKPLMGHKWELGYMGIDMITYTSTTPSNQGLTPQICIQPLELNLRCTMGVVCRLWHDFHRQDGIFRISPMLQDGHFSAEFLISQ